MKKLVIFGFDGTILDTSPGIVYCLNTTAITIGYTPVEPDALYKVVGIPLDNVFRILFNMKDDEIEYATNNYSKMYSQKGKEMFIVYESMIDVIKELKEKGYMIAIATRKHIMFVSDMIEMLNIEDDIDIICATDVDTYKTGKDLLLDSCQRLGVSVEESVVIGDSDIEAKYAGEIGMDFVAAFYGWGFKNIDSEKKAEYKLFVEKVSDIPSKISTLN